jgi:hypothetical protein
MSRAVWSVVAVAEFPSMLPDIVDVKVFVPPMVCADVLSTKAPSPPMVRTFVPSPALRTFAAVFRANSPASKELGTVVPRLILMMGAGADILVVFYWFGFGCCGFLFWWGECQ